jgi:YbbR domain-containing protein
MGEEGRIRGVTLKLELPADLVYMDDAMPKIDLEVRASKRILKKLTPSDFSALIEVSGSKYIPGEPYFLKIDTSDIKGPIGVRVISADPTEMLITLDKNVSRKATVKARFKNRPALPYGYDVKTTKIIPNKVVLTGPGELVSSIKDIFTENIDLRGASESFDFTASLSNPSALIKINPQKVMAKVEIVKQVEEKILKSVPIKILYPNMVKREFDAELLSTPHVDITVVGIISKIKKLSQGDFKPYVDISPLKKPGVYNVDIDCWASVEGIKIKKIHPKRIQLKIMPPAEAKKAE